MTDMVEAIGSALDAYTSPGKELTGTEARRMAKAALSVVLDRLRSPDAARRVAVLDAILAMRTEENAITRADHICTALADHIEKEAGI